MTECIFCTESLLRPGDVPAALCCGHVFHERCIKTWYRTKKSCPTCKQTQQLAASRLKDGIIRLYLDGAGPGSPSQGAGGSAQPVDLTEDAGAPGAAAEVPLLRHSLLYAQRELEEKKLEADVLKGTVAGLQGALQLEADRSRSLVSQVRAAQAAAAQRELQVRNRENEIRDLKQKMSSEREEVRQARSLRATAEAHELEKEGQHEQAIVRLVQNCSGEELTAQLQKMLGFRHERCAKLEDHANDLRREIQALKAADNQRRRKEDQLMADIKILRQKLEKSRASAHESQGAQASAALRAGSPVPASPRRHEERSAATADLQDETPKTIGHGVAGGMRPGTYPVLLAVANTAKSRRGLGSLVRPVQTGSLLSNDVDFGGRFIRSGPDGMGGTVHVCVQAQQPTASARSSTGERLLKPLSARSIACNPVGIPVGRTAKRPNTAPAKKDEVHKKQRVTNDISSFFGAAVKQKKPDS